MGYNLFDKLEEVKRILSEIQSELEKDDTPAENIPLSAPAPVIENVPLVQKLQMSTQSDPVLDAQINKTEKKFGEEMSEEDLAKYFKEKKEEPKQKAKTLKEMTKEEIESWERAQDNSTDIYKIAARVKNLARGPGMNLTPQGEMLANTYTHVLKAFYDFAEKIEDKNIKAQLTDLIRSQEGMPGNLISAAGAGVRRNK